MTALGFTLFATALGSCGIAWSERGIVGVQLPEADAAATRARLRRRFPTAREAAPPGPVAPAIEGITALVAGASVDLSPVELDLADASPFELQVYRVARTVPPGRVLTYGEVAARLGEAGAAREVGTALGRNPVPLLVPCHRVVAAGGRLGGFSAHGGAAAKRRLLAIERARANPGPDLFDPPEGTAGNR